MRNVIPQFDALGDRRAMLQRLILIGLLLVPAAAAVMLVAAKSTPASVQSPNTTVNVPAKKTPTADSLVMPTGGIANDQVSNGTSINLSTSQSSPTAPPSVDLRVNDQQIAVPNQDNVHKVIQQGNTTTVLDISSSSNSQGSSQSSTSTNINVNSSTEAVKTDEGP